ncbi:unnamed protein product, partial [Ectocarpus sp. 4 AP-2014]
MPRRYGTRSTTKAACSKAAVAANAQATSNPTSGTARHAAAEAALLAPPPRISSQVVTGDGQQRGMMPAAAAAGVGATKRADSHLFPQVARKAPDMPHATAATTAVPPAPSAQSPAAAAVLFGTKHHPPVGPSSGVDRLRKRSRLCLGKRRRALPVQYAAVGQPSVGTAGSPSFQERFRSPFTSSAALAPPAEAIGYPWGASPGLSEGRIDKAGVLAPTAWTIGRPSTGPSPPFVGLENLGETCYVNAVLQALTACHGALTSSRGGGGGWHDVESEGSEGSSSTPPAADAAPAVAASAGTAVPVGGETGTQRNPVLVSLEQVLGEMETRNRALFQQQLVAARSQTAVSSPAEPASTGSGASSSPESKTCQPYDQTPLRPSASTGEGVRVESIAPTSLVELIRGGWLGADSARLGGGGAGATGLTDFGTGQACVSELLGKFIGLVVDDGGSGATSPGDVGGRRSGGSHSSSFCGLAQAFRGTLCARTLCVECERDRTAHEDFTELTLPPLLPPQHAPPLTAQGAISAAENDGGPSLRGRRRTIQTLVDGVFERESLAGNNKLCDSGEVFYDLIGAILHQGQTLASGHYTFALHAAAGDWASFLAQQQQQQQQADRDNRALVQQGPRGAAAAGSTCGKPDFALFDDATVRWLSPEEERTVLRGGGGGFGEPFLVFYARRP